LTTPQTTVVTSTRLLTTTTTKTLIVSSTKVLTFTSTPVTTVTKGTGTSCTCTCENAGNSLHLDKAIGFCAAGVFAAVAAI
jgi:hypothetical protein